MMFGDQGIFITRELFFKAGMFPALPIMEDYQFSLTLKEMGVKLGIARHRIKGDSSVNSDVEDEPAKKNVPGWCADRDDIEVI